MKIRFPILLSAIVSVFLLPFIIFAYAGFFQTGSAQNTETIRLYVPVGLCHPSVLPLNVALKNGYFQAKNINVNLPLLHLQDVISDYSKLNEYRDEVDVIIVGRAKFYQHEHLYPGEFKVFSFDLQDETNWDDPIIVKNNSQITSLDQLKGKTIGIVPLIHLARVAVINAMLEKNGLDSNQFTLTDASLDDLIDDRVDALYNIREPYLTLYLESGIGRMLVEGPIFAKYVFSPWPMTVTAISSDFIKENAETTNKIVQVWDKAITFIREHPDEADNILQRCVETNFFFKGGHIRQPIYWKSDEIDKNLIQRQLDWYNSIGFISRKINVNDILLFAN